MCSPGAMADALRLVRSRQRARLPAGQKPPTPRAALALAKSQAYQAAADAPATLRAYTADLANFKAWCETHGLDPMPARPETVGAYLAAAGLGYALPTLRRRVAAIARAHRIARILSIHSIQPSARPCAALRALTAHRPAGPRS